MPRQRVEKERPCLDHCDSHCCFETRWRLKKLLRKEEKQKKRELGIHVSESDEEGITPFKHGLSRQAAAELAQSPSAVTAPFGSSSARKDILTNNPYPGLAAFEPPRMYAEPSDVDLYENFDSLAHRRSTKLAPDFNRYASRKETKPQGLGLPDSGIYQHVFLTSLEKRHS